MITWLLFQTKPGDRFLAWLENRFNLAIVTNPHYHFVDAHLLATTTAPPPRKEAKRTH